MSSAMPPAASPPPLSLSRRPRPTPPPGEAAGADLLAGATIVAHEAPGAAAAAGPPVDGLPGLGPDWERVRRFGGGALLLLCFVLFGWQIWRGREPAAVTIQPLAVGTAAEIKVH